MGKKCIVADVRCTCGKITTVTDDHPGVCVDCGAKLGITRLDNGNYTPWSENHRARKERKHRTPSIIELAYGEW